MTCKHYPNSRPGAQRAKATATGAAAVLTLAAGLAGCTDKTPKGQVVAIVNGQDVTMQDLMAEGRGIGAQGQQDPRSITQRVVTRALLAQAAHDRKLDTYPGYPSDQKRLQQNFLAQKVLTAVVKPPAKPTPDQISAFMAAHPNIFSNRYRLKMDEIRFQGTSDLKEINGADTLDDVQRRLKALNGDPKRGTRILDTAQMPAPVAANLVAQPDNKLFIVKERDAAIAVTIIAREHVQGPPEQEQALAANLMQQSDTQRQVEAEAGRLKIAAKIAYQKGFEPAAPSPPGKPAAPAKPS